MSLPEIPGWWPSNDLRRGAYPLRAALPREVIRRGITRRWRYWYAGWKGDQKATSSCVAYATLHAWHGSPDTHRGQPKPFTDPFALYLEGQDRDPWPGREPDYYGTSTDAVALAMRERGMISGFYWAESIDDVLLALCESSGVIAGTNWYSGMFNTDDRGRVEVTGSIAGGHAYWLDGVNLDREEIRFLNSWGNWGDKGRGRIGIADFERLLNEHGEACILVES